jgi:hypothetical protein
MSLSYGTRLALRRSGFSTEPLYRFAGAVAKPRPFNLPKRSEMGETESAEDWVIIPLDGPRRSAVIEPIAAAAAAPAEDVLRSFNWTLRKDAKHTCADWDPSDEDAMANPPAFWCPACRYAEEMAHQERSRKAAAAAAAAAAAVPAPVAAPVEPHQPITLQVNAFEKEFIQAGGAAGRMMRDSLIGGGTSKYMLSWADYCLMDDPHFLDVKELSEEERKRLHRPAPRSAAAPMRSVRIKSSKSAEEREVETRAWLATPRNKRLAYHKGALTTDLCVPKDNSVVIANILNDSQTAYGDLRELLSQHGVVVDLYRPAKPGAPMFVGFLTEGDVAKVIAAFPDGIRYNGRLLPVERAIARSKTGAQMAKIARATAQ